MDLEKLSNILGADTVKKIYEDGLSTPVQESSKTITDFIKAARLFTAPVQLLAAYQDRLTKYLNKVREGVPEARQIESPPSISGPVMERLKYLEETNHLTTLYLSLLQRSIDRERINEAHPAFMHIIDQLSPDEAMILFLLKSEPLRFEYTMDLLVGENNKQYFGSQKMIIDGTPRSKIAFVEYFNMYISHMTSLNLLRWPILDEQPICNEKKVQTGINMKSMIQLTQFGDLFVKACIPPEGFIPIV